MNDVQQWLCGETEAKIQGCFNTEPQTGTETVSNVCVALALDIQIYLCSSSLYRYCMCVYIYVCVGVCVYVLDHLTSAY